MMQCIFLILPIVSSCFIGALLLCCFASAAYRLHGNVPSDLKWVLYKAASLDAFLVCIVTIIILSSILASSLNHISNHIILSLDILFLFSSLILILFHTIKQPRFAPGK